MTDSPAVWYALALLASGAGVALLAGGATPPLLLLVAVVVIAVARGARQADAAAESHYYRALAHASADLVLVLGTGDRVMEATHSARYAGIPVGSGLDRLLDDGTLSDLVSLARSMPSQPIRGTCHLEIAPGRVRVYDVTVTDLSQDHDLGAVVVRGHDVTDRTRVVEQLSLRARTDPLTGLPNGDELRRQLRVALAPGARRPVTVLYLDLDRFKPINDRFGHDVGDAVLVELSRRMRSSLAPADVLARLHGDEFAVIFGTDLDDSSLQSVTRRISAACADPIAVDGVVHRLTVSIGAARSTPTMDAESLLRAADHSMYDTKRDRRARESDPSGHH